MIPAEAVEAAAKALYFYLDEDHRGAPAPWESLANDNDAKIDAMDAAHIALEAAAPYLLRAAWDEGHLAGWNDRDDDAASGWVPSGYTQDTPNPYRAAAERAPYMRDTEGEK